MITNKSAQGPFPILNVIEILKSAKPFPNDHRKLAK